MASLRSGESLGSLQNLALHPQRPVSIAGEVAPERGRKAKNELLSVGT